MEAEIRNISDKMWEALKNADKNELENLIYPDAKFIHMGVMLDRGGEIEAAVEKKIITKTVDVKDCEVRVYENTAIVLKKIELTAVVFGEEHVNPFMVTEVYVNNEGWKLANLSYTKISY